MYSNDPQVLAMIPERVKQVIIEPVEEVSLWGRYWDGGSKREYTVVNVATGERKSVPDLACHPMHAGKTETLPLIPNMVVLCKQYSGIKHYWYVYCHPATMPVRLTEEVQLTENEYLCLHCTVSYKSSYGGIKEYRRVQSGLSSYDWEAAKASLVDKGYLNSRGAVTLEGRNVKIPNEIKHRPAKY